MTGSSLEQFTGEDSKLLGGRERIDPSETSKFPPYDHPIDSVHNDNDCGGCQQLIQLRQSLTLTAMMAVAKMRKLLLRMRMTHRMDICMIGAKQFIAYAEDIPNDLTII